MFFKKKFMFTKLDVLPLKAELEDIRNMDYLREKEEKTKKEFPDITYIVKIEFTGTFPYKARGLELYLDDYLIRKYSGYKGGIFFKVYNPRFLTKHSGQRLYYCADDGKKVETKIRFPDLSDMEKINNLRKSIPKLPTFKEVLCFST